LQLAKETDLKFDKQVDSSGCQMDNKLQETLNQLKTREEVYNPAEHISYNLLDFSSICSVQQPQVLGPIPFKIPGTGTYGSPVTY